MLSLNNKGSLFNEAAWLICEAHRYMVKCS